MPDYDERARRFVAMGADKTAIDMASVAIIDEEEGGPLERESDYLDRETLASHNLKVIRKRLGISQQQIADRLPYVSGGAVRLAQTQIAKIERGERPWRVNEMFAIIKVLGVSWKDLFHFPGPLEEDSDHLIMLSARNKYQLAARATEEAGEVWGRLEVERLKAGMKMARTAAQLGIEDPDVTEFLELYGAALVLLEEERDWENYDLDAVRRERQERGRAAWEQLLKEVREEEGETDLKEQGHDD